MRKPPTKPEVVVLKDTLVGFRGKTLVDTGYYTRLVDGTEIAVGPLGKLIQHAMHEDDKEETRQ
jgi:hypothetical protein